MSEAPDYAFPHSAGDESRRLQLLEQRLDPLTKRRIQRLGVGQGARCLEIGGGRGSVTRWLSDAVGPAGRVIATDLQLGFLAGIHASNVEVLRHDIRTGTFPPGSFDLIHTRAVLMHISPGVDLLRRMASWLAPGGWLVLEEPDFGMWIGDADPVWGSNRVSGPAHGEPGWFGGADAVIGRTGRSCPWLWARRSPDSAPSRAMPGHGQTRTWPPQTDQHRMISSLAIRSR